MKKDEFNFDQYLENLDGVFTLIGNKEVKTKKRGMRLEIMNNGFKVNKEAEIIKTKGIDPTLSRQGGTSLGASPTSFLDLLVKTSHSETSLGASEIRLDKKKVSQDNRFMFLRRKMNKWYLFWKKRLASKSREGIGRSRISRASNRINFKIFKKQFSFSKSSVFKYFAIVCFVGIVFATLFAIGIFAWYSKDLPHPDKIMRKDGFATKIFDRNDKLLYEVFVDEKRIPVAFDQIPADLKNATIAIEDKDFYKHKGFDPLGYLRIVKNVIFNRRLIGGSTLTQQIVKNVLLSDERTISRKIKELVLAIQIERKYTKDQILNIYLNEAPYGGTAWGVVAAAEMLFGKEVKDLSFIESVVLAGLPQSPSYFSPYGANPEAFKFRSADVLRRMREDGYINKDQEAQGLRDLDSIEFLAPGGKILAPHFVMYVKNILSQKYGENLVEQGGLTVKTSLDYEMQEQVQTIVAEEIAKVEEQDISNGAAVVIDPNNGQILAMVGSKDYFAADYDGKVNVTTSLRQPGSSIKPVTYAQALVEGFTPESMIMDVRTEFPGVSPSEPYVPKNYNGKFNGPVNLRNALGSSLNIPAVKLLALVGVEDMMQLGYDMGISTFEPTKEITNRLGLSVTLGGGEVKLLELTNAYSSFANGGYRTEPISILEVKDKDGKTLEKLKEVKGKQVMDSGVAYLISHMLSDNNARLLSFGANSLLNIDWRTVAVKTGTTDDQRDNWTIGWTPQVIVGVWVGNNDNSKMKSVASGISGASPIWRRSLLAALEGKPVVEFSRPANIENVILDKVTGYPAHDGFEQKEVIVMKGTVPAEKDPIHVRLKVCRSDEKKLAPVTLITKGEYNEKEFFIFRENDLLFGNDNNHWQKGIDEWVNSQGDEKYHPPTEYCDSDDSVVIRINEPGDHANNVPNKFKIEVSVGSNEEIEKIKFYANGSELGEVKKKPYELEVELTDGVYELKAVVYTKKDKTADNTIRIGVNKNWDWVAPTPTPTPTVAPTATPVITPTPTPSPTPTGTPTS